MSSAARQATERSPAPNRNWESWESRIPRFKFREAAELGISNRLFRLAVELDLEAGVRFYATIGNEDLRVKMGKKSDASISDMLRAGEKLNLWHRVMIPGRIDPKTGRPRITGRIGIVLLWRPSVLPVATAETLDESIARMRQDIARREVRLHAPSVAKPTPEPPEIGTRFPGRSVPDFRGDRYQISGALPSLREVDKPSEATTPIRACEADPDPSSSFSVRLPEGIQTPEETPTAILQTTQTAAPMETTKAPAIAPETAALVDRLMALLEIVKTLATVKVREWVIRHGLEKAELAIVLGESLKAKGKAVTEALLGWHLTRWERHATPLETIRKEVEAKRPRPKPAAAPMMQNYNPPGSKEPGLKAPGQMTEAERSAEIAEIEHRLPAMRNDVANASRDMKPVFQKFLDQAQARLAALDQAGEDPGGPQP